MGSVAHLSQQVLKDLEKLCSTLYKSPREKLSILVAVALEAGSCNTMDWAARLPIETARAKSRYAWIERFLSAPTLPVEATIRPLAVQILSLACAGDQTAVINLDQTSLEDRHGIATVSVRVGNRDQPLSYPHEFLFKWVIAALALNDFMEAIDGADYIGKP